MDVTAVTRAGLAEAVAALAGPRSGPVRVAVDGPPPTAPEELAAAVADRLRVLGRPCLVVAADDFLRPASGRLEYGRADADAFLDGRLDVAALRREVLAPAGPGGSRRVLARLWDPVADRSYRDPYRQLAAGTVVLVAGSLLLGRNLPFDLAVHLHMSAAALARRLEPDERWTLPAYARYETEHDPAGQADLLVLADHPDRPAIRH